MGSCGKSSILDDASSGPIIEQRSRVELPMQSVPVQRSCPEVTCNALDFNVERSNTMEGCMNSSREVHTGSASTIDVPVMTRDSSLMVNENEKIDRLQCSCTVVTCNAVGFNAEHSNVMEGCMDLSGEVQTGSSSSIDVPELSRDSSLMVNKSENTVTIRQSCSVVTSNVLDPNAEISDMMERCLNSSEKVHSGSANTGDVTDVPKDSLLMVNKNENTDMLQQSCPVVTCNALGSNVEHSNMMEGCMIFSREVHSGSASPIDASEITRNSFLEDKSEITDNLQQSCFVATCNVLDSNFEHSNLVEGRIKSNREVASSIDTPEVIRDSLLMENKSENADILQQSCLVVTCNALDSNVKHSNMMEGCMNSSTEVHTGTASPVDVPEMSKDSSLMVNKREKTEMSLLEKTSENDSQTCPSLFCAQIKLSNLESVRFVSEGKPHAKDGFKMTSDFISTTGLPKDCVHQDGHKDEKSNIFHSAGVSFSLMEDKSDAGLPTGFLVYCHQQSESKDTMRNANPLLEGVNEGDLICGIEADACKQTHSQGSEVPTDVTYTETEPISDQRHDQKDCGDESSPYEDFVDKESITDTHVQVFSSPGHQRRSLPVAYSPGKATHSEKGIDNIDTDFDAEDVVRVKGKSNDVMTEMNVEMKNNMPQDDNACKLSHSSSKADANCTLRKTFPHESDLPSVDYISIGSPKDVPDLLKEVNGSISYSSLVGDSGEADRIRKDIIQVDCISESNYSGNASLPIRRNSRRSKSGHKTQTKRASRKCKNKTSVPLLGGDMKIILEAARKKRSCFSKPARSSIWGLVGNINKFFEQYNELGVDEVMCQGLGRVRGARKSGTRNKNGAISSSLTSMKKCCASTTRVRLKIKLGKEVHLSCSDVLVPEVMNGSCSASNMGPGPGFQERNSSSGYKCLEEVAVGKSESLTSNLDEDALVLNGEMTYHHLEAAATTEKSHEVAEEGCHMIPLERMIEPLRETANDKGMDPGTSPDSEVINSIPEVQVGERHQQGLHDAILGSPKVSDSLQGVSGCRRRKKKDKLTSSRSSIVEDGSQGPPRKNKTKHSKNRGRKKNSNDVVCSTSLHTSTVINAVSYSTSHKELSSDSLPPSGELELEDSTEALKVKRSMQVETTYSPNDESHGIDNLLSSARSSGRKLPKSLTSCKIINPQSKASDSMSQKKTGSRRREKQLKPVKKSEAKGKAVSEAECLHAEHVDGSYKLDDIGKINAGDNKLSVNGSNTDMVVGTGLVEQRSSPHNAWVRCDDCHKWRRIPVDLADLIEETKCTWTCKDSSDKAFSDCSIPQEKSNAEINAELGLSDASGEEDAYEGCRNYKKLEYQHLTVHQESTFTHILTNEFLHRCRKMQTIDEVMVCHCKPPSEGRFGCGDECLNRMLNIECVQGTCPCGDLCSNQQFQQRNYASLTWFKCGKKGYGLKAIEDISKGKFLIEYVGEVLDMHAYEARQREYAFKGHRHFYFMTLNGSEVIDASAKGNLGRFINHSCDPNCRTEKWMVNGEICIGLFALRDIKQGEEVTFDYNYVRVFGAAAKKCYCGSPLCHGYIGGGDPLNAEVIVQGDSDEEFPEPVMLTEDGEIEGSTPRSDVMQAERNLLKDRDLVEKFRSAQVPDNNYETENSVNPSPSTPLLPCPLDVEDSMGKLPLSDVEEISHQVEDAICKSMPAVQHVSKSELPDSISSIQGMEASAPLISKVISNFIKNKRESKSEILEDRHGFPKTHLLVKTSRANGSVKKGKVHANHSNGLKAAVTANRLQAAPIKPKKVVEGSSNGRFEAVQEKLKDLLDEDGEGGISKRKDATKGYLKLLLLTVASDDRNNGEAIQSNRDLSMILGALLKTKSRAVLNDIINKNGLQMLHNIMKQYRRDFKKTPILRKLLKVLEYLAASKILTLEHINGGPPCHGMESFRESMLSLTEHDDKQVHQIARSFRDRWIRKPFRRHGYVDRDDFKGEPHRNFNCNRFSTPQKLRRELDVRPTEAIDCVQQSKLVTTSIDAGAQEGCSALPLDGGKVDGTKRRKRKSRWDQPAETISNLSSSPCKKQNVDSGPSMHADAAIDSFDVSQNICEDFPPGFSCPVQPQLGSSNASPHPVDLALRNVGNSGCPLDTVIGHPKEKFNSRMPVSYGIPLSFVQQFGTPHAEISGSWVTAPGVPFSPFPPLPCYPRDNKDCQPSSSTNAAAVDQPAEVQQRDMSGLVGCCSDDLTFSTTDASPKDIDLPHEDDKQLYKRLKGSSCDLGRKYFRQQKWNNSKIHRPWFRRNAWGSNGNYTAGGTCSVSVGDEPSESKVAYSSADVICRAEEGDNNV